MVNLVALKRKREAVLELLNTAYATDVLDTSELEQRIERAQAARTLEALDELVADLEGVEELLPGGLERRQQREATQAPPVARHSEALAVRDVQLVPLDDVPLRRSIVSFFGSTRRGDGWLVPRRTSIWTLFGSTVIDLRDAHLAAGVNRVQAHAAFGSVEVIVPPGLQVEVDGWGVFGSFESIGRPAPARDSAQPVVRVTGIALFGSVEVQERLPGESARQAHRRRKRERKRRRRERRRELRARGADERALPRADLEGDPDR